MMGSEYLMKPPRSLREACKEIATTNPEFVPADCEHCVNKELCGIYQQIDRDFSEKTVRRFCNLLAFRVKAALARTRRG